MAAMDRINAQLAASGLPIRVTKLSEPHQGPSVYYRAHVAPLGKPEAGRFNHVIEEQKDGSFRIY
jgi:hypothetical protein